MTKIANHVLLAANEGMAAGFRQFASASQKSGLPAVQDAWEPFAPLNRKRRFDLYCELFGPQVESLGAPKASATRANVVESRTSDEVQRLIEAAQELMRQAEELRSESVVEPKAPVKRSTDRSKPKASKPAKVVLTETKFGAGAVKALGLPTKVGAKFTYKGKRSTSKWVVARKNRDGSILATRA